MSYLSRCYRVAIVIEPFSSWKRYGLKFKIHVLVIGMCLLLVASSAMGLLAPAASWAQAEAAALGPAPNFDWSDYRGTANGRLYLARLSSVSLKGNLKRNPGGQISNLRIWDRI